MSRSLKHPVTVALCLLPTNDFKIMVSTLPKGMASSLLEDLPAGTVLEAVWETHLSYQGSNHLSLVRRAPSGTVLVITDMSTRGNDTIRVRETHFKVNLSGMIDCLRDVAVQKRRETGEQTPIRYYGALSDADISSVITWLKKGNYIPKLTGQI